MKGLVRRVAPKRGENMLEVTFKQQSMWLWDIFRDGVPYGFIAKRVDAFFIPVIPDYNMGFISAEIDNMDDAQKWVKERIG